jgi:hypothetical protein
MRRVERWGQGKEGVAKMVTRGELQCREDYEICTVRQHVTELCVSPLVLAGERKAQ